MIWIISTSLQFSWQKETTTITATPPQMLRKKIFIRQWNKYTKRVKIVAVVTRRNTQRMKDIKTKLLVAPVHTQPGIRSVFRSHWKNVWTVRGRLYIRQLTVKSHSQIYNFCSYCTYRWGPLCFHFLVTWACTRHCVKKSDRQTDRDRCLKTHCSII